jgi:hypothetical protein
MIAIDYFIEVSSGMNNVCPPTLWPSTGIKHGDTAEGISATHTELPSQSSRSPQMFPRLEVFIRVPRDDTNATYFNALRVDIITVRIGQRLA